MNTYSPTPTISTAPVAPESMYGREITCPTHVVPAPENKWVTVKLSGHSFYIFRVGQRAGAVLLRNGEKNPLATITYKFEAEVWLWVSKQKEERGLLPQPKGSQGKVDRVVPAHLLANEVANPAHTEALEALIGGKMHRSGHKGPAKWYTLKYGNVTWYIFNLPYLNSMQVISSAQLKANIPLHKVVPSSYRGSWEDMLEEADQRNAAHQKAKTRLSLPTKLRVGDILHRTFGYNMTLNTLFQITAIKGTKATVRRLSTHRDGGGYSGKETPLKDIFCESYGGETTATLREDYIVLEKEYYLLWDGKPRYYNTLD